MKKIVFLFLILLQLGCSKFSEDFELLTSQTPFNEIETALPIVNIHVDDTDFQRMINTPEEEIEIPAFFNLYRDQILLIEDQKVEIEVKGGFSTKYPL